MTDTDRTIPAEAHKPFRCKHRLRVRWSEVDAQRVVFNANYLAYADTAVTEYWRALGLPFEQVLPRFGGDIFVRRATLDFRASARYDDWVEVGVRCERIGRSSLTVACGLFGGGTQLMEVELVYVYADPQAGKSLELPALLRDWLTAYEAGEPMVQVELGPWERLGAEARPLRTAVFIDEQRVPVEMEWDDDDAHCLHAVARNRLGDAVATARLLPAVDGRTRIGRMAVTRSLRGTGVGREVLRALMRASAQRGDREILLHAQTSALGFYAREGFVVHGERFEEAGIEHVEMVKLLGSAH